MRDASDKQACWVATEGNPEGKDSVAAKGIGFRQEKPEPHFLDEPSVISALLSVTAECREAQLSNPPGTRQTEAGPSYRVAISTHNSIRGL